MKFYNRILSFALVLMMLASILATPLAAAGIEFNLSGGVYKIANDYVRFVYNSNTGGFSVETKEGHPQKSFDNNIPLLYSEDSSRSNGTSFTTVRIDGKDYVFGQDYSWFGIETTLGTPVVENEGRSMSVTWGIKGYLITQMVVISEVVDSDLAGNVGIGYTVVNTNETPGTVGIRLLLDNALDNKIDAPYVTTDSIFSPTIVETEFSDENGNMPVQLTYTDSLSNAKKMGYMMLKGWDGAQDTTPDKVVVGHWANLANTRFDYTPDANCDFSNYSNVHRVPDTATAVYWDEEQISAGSYRTMEVLYGIGNFSSDNSGKHLGVSLNVPSVKLDKNGTGYKDNGEIEIVVTLDNTVDAALDLITAQVDIFLDDGLTFKDSGSTQATFTYGEIIGEKIESIGLPKGTTKTIKKTVVVSKAENITAKSVTVCVSGTEYVSATEWVQANYTEQRNILVPGVDGILPEVKMTSVSPKMVFTDGEKNITVSGDMTPLKALSATTGWELYLVKEGEKIRIDKSTIAFPGENYQTMTFSTDEKLEIGEYTIEFRFTDKQLKNELKNRIIAEQKLMVSDDETYRSQNYGLVALIRFDVGGTPIYDFISFINEEELNDFIKDVDEASGAVRPTATGISHVKDADGQPIRWTFTEGSEVLAVVRGKIRVLETEDGKPYFQANPSDGEVTINNLLVYSGSEPLTMSAGDDGWTTGSAHRCKISAKGLISVIGSIDIWPLSWSFEVVDGRTSTLVDAEDGQEFTLKLGPGASILQYIAGFVIDLKYGVMTKDEDEGLYGVSFGGKITIPIKAKKKDAAAADPDATTDASATTDAPADTTDAPDNTTDASTDKTDKPVSTDKPADTDPPASTDKPTTDAPASTDKPTTDAPASTDKPTTDAPASTDKPTTDAPASTDKPTTDAPASTDKPTTDAPASTDKPTTDAPASTDKPTTDAPASTDKPTTDAPASTDKPTTDAPASTDAPVTTDAPATTTDVTTSATTDVTVTTDVTTSATTEKLGLTKPSGEDPPSLKITNSDSKVGKYVNGLGKVPQEPDDGSITAEIESILFGQKGYDEKTGEYDTGFVGINCSLEVKLPADVLGGRFKNKVGIEATFNVNTLDNEYGLDFGLEVKDMFECEVTIELKQITVNSKEKIMLDKLKLYLGGDFIKIPFFGIPGVFVTGIGGGVSNIAEAVETDNFWAVVAEVRLDLIFVELLKGKFEGEFSSSYVKLSGEMTLKNDDDGKVLKVDGGLNIQWKPNGQFNFYGNATLLSGLLKGGITIKIEKDYFHAYVYASLMIPEDIPIVGGLELSGFEAGGGVDFIGANLKIIGIKFGFIYYWGDRFEFGKGIDLSGRGAAVITSDASYFDEVGKYVHCTALYGTNLRRLSSQNVNIGRAGEVVVVKTFDPTAEDALLLEIPFEGHTLPTAEDIVIITPSGKQLDIVNDDGNGGGNFLINDRGENNGKYIYVSITDKELLEAGDWTVSVNTDGVSIDNFEVDGVDNLPELSEVNFTYNSEKPYELSVNYELDSESSVPGAMDIYLTENSDAVNALRQSVADPDAGLISLGRVTLDEMKSGSITVEIPDTLANGEYTVLCMLSQDAGGMSIAASEDFFSFKNNKLPENVKGVYVTYGGDGDMRIEIERDRDVNYNEYQIKILDENMNLYKNCVFEQEAPALVYNAETKEYENTVFYFGKEQGLEVGRTYHVAVDTIRNVDGKKYYSDETVYSDAFTMTKAEPAVLLSVESNINRDADIVNVDTFEATYTFDKDVYLYMSVDTLMQSYSTECQKVHTVSIPLKEGSHFIDFVAVTPEFDTTTGEMYEVGLFGFEVDTTAPLLKVGQTVANSVEAANTDSAVAVSGQNVVVSDDGKISLSGVTDTDATLTLGGTSEGIEKYADGSFTVNRTVERSRDVSELELCAMDKAGNKTTILIHLVNPSLYTFDGIELVADKDTELVDDIKKIKVPVGATVSLSAFGINGNEQIALNGTDVAWSVLYEQNIISFSDGKLTALVPGETAVCVIYKEATFEVDGELKTGQLNDVIIVEVTELKVNVSTGEDGVTEEIAVQPIRTDYAEYSKVAIVIEKEDISSVVTYVDGEKTKFYYVGDDTYVATFDKNVSDEDILTGLKITESVPNEDGTVPERVYTLVTGDYDGNGVVNNTDINLAIYTSVGKDAKLKVDAFARGDINGDGVINIIDAQLMRIITMQK